MALKARSWDKTQGLRPNYILNLGAFVNFHIVVFVSPPLLVSENRSHITKTNVPKVQLSTTTVTGRPPKLSQNLDLRYPHAMVMGTVIHPSWLQNNMFAVSTYLLLDNIPTNHPEIPRCPLNPNKIMIKISVFILP